MLKRILATVIASVALVIGLPNIGYGQQSVLDSGNAPPNIRAGLCVGASLDLSASSAARCARQNPNPSSTTSSSSATTTTRPPQNTTPSQTGMPPMHQTNPPTTTSSPTYAALGDSVAAGLGLAGMADQTVCGRSAQAYPNLVASARGLALNQIACTGATAGDLITKQRVSGPNLPPQLDQALASGTPQLMTITAGANDVHWDIFLRKCFSSTCGTPTDSRVISALMVPLQVNLVTTFSQIQQRTNGNPPQVVITGYFNPVSQNCTATEPRLTADEINWITMELNALNQTIQTAASGFSFVRFAPVDFTGHDVCSANPWVQTLSDPAPFHPNATGQSAIAQAIN